MSIFEQIHTLKQGIPKESSEFGIAKTRQAVLEAANHEFRFGYQYGFEQDRVRISWGNDIKLYLYIEPGQPHEPVWFGNCYDDAWVSREFLISKIGKDAKISIQKLVSDYFSDEIPSFEHYRLLVEHHDSKENDSVFSEIDHSPFYRKKASGDQSSIKSWVETDSVQKGKRNLIRQDTDTLLPMCEYEIDGNEKILYFKFKVDAVAERVFIIMQQMGISNTVPEPNGLEYAISFSQLHTPEAIMEDLVESLAFRVDGPFSNQLNIQTLERMKRGLQLIVAKIPPYKPKRNRFF